MIEKADQFKEIILHYFFAYNWFFFSLMMLGKVPGSYLLFVSLLGSRTRRLSRAVIKGATIHPLSDLAIRHKLNPEIVHVVEIKNIRSDESNSYVLKTFDRKVPFKTGQVLFVVIEEARQEVSLAAGYDKYLIWFGCLLILITYTYLGFRLLVPSSGTTFWQYQNDMTQKNFTHALIYCAVGVFVAIKLLMEIWEFIKFVRKQKTWPPFYIAPYSSLILGSIGLGSIAGLLLQLVD